MSDKSSRPKVPNWRRPAGPPSVWRVIEARDAAGKPIRLSIQEVPEDRYPETVEHMSKYFVADEATCKCLKLAKDPDAISDFKSLWEYLLKIGISIAAYKLGANDELLELAGTNILFVVTEEIEKALENRAMTFKSAKARKLFGFMHSLGEKADPRDIYGVDKYLSALGLSVAPSFRGQKLGVRLLEARSDIGRKYGLEASSTIFTGPASQTQAARADFESAYAQQYREVRDEAGELLFPGIEAEEAKVMMKLLR